MDEQRNEDSISGIVNISEAKAQLSRLVARAQAGEAVLIGKAGKPVAVLSAYEVNSEPRTLGGWEGRVWIADDFDEPLPDEIQRHFEGRDA